MKYMLLFTFLIVSFFAYSQSQIKGIGMFNIGDPETEIIDRLKKELRIKRVPISHSATMYGSELFKLQPDTATLHNSPANALFCSHATAYEIRQYTISGVDLIDLSLKFNNGRLYEISFMATKETSEAMVIKLGQPEHISIVDSVFAIYNHTSPKMLYRKQDRRVSWAKGQIEIFMADRDYPPRHWNGNSLIGTFIIRDKPTSLAVMDCEKREVSMFIERKKKQKKDSLKDF